MSIEEAHANQGKRVYYTGPGGKIEYGTITSCSPKYVRVLFDGDAVAQYTEAETIALVIA